MSKWQILIIVATGNLKNRPFTSISLTHTLSLPLSLCCRWRYFDHFRMLWLVTFAQLLAVGFVLAKHIRVYIIYFWSNSKFDLTFEWLPFIMIKFFQRFFFAYFYSLQTIVSHNSPLKHYFWRWWKRKSIDFSEMLFSKSLKTWQFRTHSIYLISPLPRPPRRNISTTS